MSLIEREALLKEYDKAHVGPPGGARKLIKEAPEVPPKVVAEIKIDGDTLRKLVDEAIEEIKAELFGNSEQLDTISRQAAIDALWKALYEYEDKTEKQFQESDELDIEDWFQHRIFVQNMSDIDRQTILNLPSAQPERPKGKWIMEGTELRRRLRCSCCSSLAIWAPYAMSFIAPNFCPHCGAEMSIREEEQ